MAGAQELQPNRWVPLAPENAGLQPWGWFCTNLPTGPALPPAQNQGAAVLSMQALIFFHAVS